MGKRKRSKQKRSSTLFGLLVVFLLAYLIQCAVDRRAGHSWEEECSTQIVVSFGQSGEGAEFVTSGLEVPVPAGSEEGRVLRRMGYVLSYNDVLKLPNWVAWHLDREKVAGKQKRTDDFLPDPDVPEKLRSTDADYYRSRYDRGHMAPAGDMKWSVQAMEESFYFSNICPQAPNMNRGDWRELEEECRKWAARGDVYLTCGPLFYSGKPIKRIGKGKVAVPHGFFKVVLLKEKGGVFCAAGFLYPNDDCNRPIADYAVSVDSVEALTGYDFYSLLPDDVEQKVEAHNGIACLVAQ